MPPQLVKDRLLAKIRDRSATTGVIGLGYVGLPLAMEFADAGFKVIGYDVNERVVAALMRGESHIQDVPARQVAKHVKAGRFVATTDEARLSETDAISIAVPTPLAKTRDPDMTFFIAAAEAVARRARAGMIVVLESTTYPGTTRDVLQPRLEARGLTIGTDIFLVFSPERVDPGNPTWNTKNTPKVLGGITPACTDIASRFYASCIDTTVPVSSPEAAELVKLLRDPRTAVHGNTMNLQELGQPANFPNDLRRQLPRGRQNQRLQPPLRVDLLKDRHAEGSRLPGSRSGLPDHILARQRAR